MTGERPSPAGIRAALRAASPEGRLEAHEAALRDADLLAAAEADGADLTRWRWQVEAARAELGRGHVDPARAHIAAADRDFLAVLHRLDPDRKRGVGTLRASRTGGQMRAGNFAPDTEARLAEMDRLISGGRNVKDAATALARRGIGKSAGANKRLWERHRGKRK